MADLKISQLTGAAVLTGAEIVPMDQSGTTVGATVEQIAVYVGQQGFPGVPASITPSVLTNGVSVAFTAPAYGTPPTSYLVTILLNGVVTSFTGTGTSSPIVVNGLSNNVTYTAHLQAINAAGEGPPIVSAPFTPVPTPVPGYDGTIKVSGNKLINSTNATVQLRGTNIQGQYRGMILQESLLSSGVADFTAGSVGGNEIPQGPNLAYVQKWKMNAIRIGLNEATVLGYMCYNNNGTPVNPNNYGTNTNQSFFAQLEAQMAGIAAIGCYTILVLAWTNPGRCPPLGQDYMSNQDNSIQCWQALAARYGYPNGTSLVRNGGVVPDRSVIFELFNEPTNYAYQSAGVDYAPSWSQLFAGANVGFGTTYNTQGFKGSIAGNIGYSNVNPYTCSAPTNGSSPHLGGEILTIGTLVGGTGGTAGSYTNVPLTGGSGTGATANVTVAGGAVTFVKVLAPYGKNYAVGDTLSAVLTNIGNTTGFSIKVASVSIPQHFTPGELVVASTGGAQRIMYYYLNTTTGLPASGLGQIGLYQEQSAATGGTTTTLVDTSRTGIFAWTTNCFVGQTVNVLHGSIYTGTVTANTANTLTFASLTSSYVPVSGDAYWLTPVSVTTGATITGQSSGTTTTLTSGIAFYTAGHTQMLTAIRNAGAGNVCLMSGLNYNQDLGNTNVTWATYAPSDTTAPTGWNTSIGGTWTPQIAACWHPYPCESKVTAAVVASGGSGYSVGDKIYMPMLEDGSATSGSVYYQPRFTVATVSGSAVATVTIDSGTGGIPNQSTGSGPTGGGTLNIDIPTNPVAQSFTSGSGTGATFNLTYTYGNTGGNTSAMPNVPSWPVALALLTTPGCPLVITETGEHSGTGINGSPWMSAMTSWCDTNGVSMVCFAWVPTFYSTLGCDFVMVENVVDTPISSLTPSPGYGAFMYNWFTTHSA